MSENNNGMGGAAGFMGSAPGSMPLDWGKLAFDSIFAGGNQPGEEWLENARAAIKADEVAQAGKQIGRAYIEAHERAALIAIDLRERLAGVTNADWIKSMARTQAALERDAANSYFSLARGLLS